MCRSKNKTTTTAAKLSGVWQTQNFKGEIMKRFYFFAMIIVVLLSGASGVRAQQTQPTPVKQPEIEEWKDDFSGAKLNETNWEKFTFEGGSGGKLEVKDGELRIRGGNKTRAGVRSVKTFTGDRFIVEAQVAKVGAPLPEPGNSDILPGFANVTILFDGSGRNRIEWGLTSDGNLEAWVIKDGQGERLDNRTLGTKMKNPYLSIVRRGDEFLFIINSPDGKAADAQVGLTKVIKNMPNSFHLMLYGYGSSENNWSSARVVVAKK
jgi:hypothetical protein